MIWTSFDTWMLISVMLAAVACALPGCFLLIRGMSLMGDAISHAVLPGIALSFLLTGERSSPVMFLGAVLAAVVMVMLSEFLRSKARVESSASLGTVFSILFALGLLLIVQGADNVDLDPNCVLYGAVELTVLDTIEIFNIDVPRTIPLLLIIVCVNITITLVFFKELNIASFDSGFARFLGFRPLLLHYLLMIEVGITMVAVFQIVGSILSIALLVIPAAMAGLYTKSLRGLLMMAVFFAIISAILGHISVLFLDSYWIPGANLAGMTTVCGGLLLIIGMLTKTHSSRQSTSPQSM